MKIEALRVPEKWNRIFNKFNALMAIPEDPGKVEKLLNPPAMSLADRRILDTFHAASYSDKVFKLRLTSPIAILFGKINELLLGLQGHEDVRDLFVPIAKLNLWSAKLKYLLSSRLVKGMPESLLTKAIGANITVAALSRFVLMKASAIILLSKKKYLGEIYEEGIHSMPAVSSPSKVLSRQAQTLRTTLRKIHDSRLELEECVAKKTGREDLAEKETREAYFSLPEMNDKSDKTFFHGLLETLADSVVANCMDVHRVIAAINQGMVRHNQMKFLVSEEQAVITRLKKVCTRMYFRGSKEEILTCFINSLQGDKIRNIDIDSANLAEYEDIFPTPRETEVLRAGFRLHDKVPIPSLKRRLEEKYREEATGAKRARVAAPSSNEEEIHTDSGDEMGGILVDRTSPRIPGCTSFQSAQ